MPVNLFFINPSMNFQNENVRNSPLKKNHQKLLNFAINTSRKEIIKAYAKVRFQLERELGFATDEAKEEIKLKLEWAKKDLEYALERAINSPHKNITVKPIEVEINSLKNEENDENNLIEEQALENSFLDEENMEKCSDCECDENINLENEEQNSIEEIKDDFESKENIKNKNIEIKNSENDENNNSENKIDKNDSTICICDQEEIVKKLDYFEMEKDLNIHNNYDDLKESLNRKLADEESEEYSNIKFCGFSIFRC